MKVAAIGVVATAPIIRRTPVPVGGLGETADATAVNVPDAVRGAHDVGPQFAQDGGGVQHVACLEQALDRGFPNREGAEDQGAVGYRLVAGNLRVSSQGL